MKWTQRKSDYLLKTKYLNVRQDCVELPNGIIIDDYYVVEKENVSLIVAIDTNHNVLLKKEYRYPIDQELIELPGGTFEINEIDPLSVAKRELLEETGYQADNWDLLLKNYDYPTKDVNLVHIYLAQNIKKVATQKLDVTEDIQYQFVPLSQAIEMCMNNDICVNGTIAGLLMAARKFGI